MIKESINLNIDIRIYSAKDYYIHMVICMKWRYIMTQRLKIAILLGLVGTLTNINIYAANTILGTAHTIDINSDNNVIMGQNNTLATNTSNNALSGNHNTIDPGVRNSAVIGEANTTKNHNTFVSGS